jgi:hypothetical protein
MLGKFSQHVVIVSMSSYATLNGAQAMTRISERRYLGFLLHHIFMADFGVFLSFTMIDKRVLRL